MSIAPGSLAALQEGGDKMIMVSEDFLTDYRQLKALIAELRETNQRLSMVAADQNALRAHERDTHRHEEAIMNTRDAQQRLTIKALQERVGELEEKLECADCKADWLEAEKHFWSNQCSNNLVELGSLRRSLQQIERELEICESGRGHMQRVMTSVLRKRLLGEEVTG
jgi:chromosome segregation ATPase